jgi:hypothetical protein
MAQKTTKPTRNKGSDYTLSPDIHADGAGETTQAIFQGESLAKQEFDPEWNYTPEGDLQIPEEFDNWLKEQGYVWRWVRYKDGGEYTSRNIAKQKKKGYEFLLRRSVPEYLLEKYDRSTMDTMKDYITIHDVVFMITPLWKREKVKSALDQKAISVLKTADDLLRQNVEERAGKLELIQNARSKVKVGGTREIKFSERRQSTEG